MMFALGLSILFALAVGVVAARNRKAEAVILPLLDIFQSIPILGFFPFVIIAIYGLIPNMIGANLASAREDEKGSFLLNGGPDQEIERAGRTRGTAQREGRGQALSLHAFL